MSVGASSATDRPAACSRATPPSRQDRRRSARSCPARVALEGELVGARRQRGQGQRGDVDRREIDGAGGPAVDAGAQDAGGRRGRGGQGGGAQGQDRALRGAPAVAAAARLPQPVEGAAGLDATAAAGQRGGGQRGDLHVGRRGRARAARCSPPARNARPAPSVAPARSSVASAGLRAPPCALSAAAHSASRYGDPARSARRRAQVSERALERPPPGAGLGQRPGDERGRGQLALHRRPVVQPRGIGAPRSVALLLAEQARCACGR